MEKASRIIRGQEQVAYSSADFPFYLRRSTFSHYCPALRHACHWHDDLEFLYTEKGHIDYSVDGVIHHLREGDGIFVNARRMHYGFSPDGTDCTFVTMLIHPLLFAQSASMVERCVRPLTENAAFPARVLTPESAQWGRALSLLREIADAYDARPAYGELLLTSLLCRVLYELASHMPPPGEDPARGRRDLAVLHAIMLDVQEHMRDRLTLRSLAESGHICESSCCRLFRRLLNRTPMEYVTEVRLERGCALLARTDMTVTEIADQVGFGSPAYFAERFRAFYGMSPGGISEHEGQGRGGGRPLSAA